MKKHKWLASLDIDSQEWQVFDTAKEAIDKMKMFIKEIGHAESQPYYIAKGTLATKADCAEFGEEWPYYKIEHGAEVLKIQNLKYGVSNGITR